MPPPDPSLFAALDDLSAALDQAMRGDRYRLRQELRKLRRLPRTHAQWERRMGRLRAELERSAARRRARAAGVPRITYDPQLPVCGKREEIAAAIAANPVVIVCGETGSGKSTQLPKICLELGRGIEGLIGHTQPRRIAARSVAARVAEELRTPLGHAVGYQVRFAESLSEHTYIKLMTDGILLAELQSDRFFEQYDTIIIDEAHERSLNIDFLLGYLKQILPRRDDLKVIVTSATIDAERFSRHFATAAGPAPIVEVSGRTYPVEVRWQPLEADEESGEPDVLRAVRAAVEELAAIDRGDMLIFMPTERDIHEAAKTLRGRRLPGDGDGLGTEILPLYARLSVQEQQRVFQPHAQRRIVIATNVAESSLTVPGIRFVIDPGTARISRYSARSKTQRLPIEPVSQASADQRKGRCGRVGPGICVRLFSEDDYDSRERFTPPEIQRTNLAAVILQTKAFRLGDIESFPFLEPPRPEAIRDGYKTLYELGALDHRNELTDVGRQLSRMPVDPRIGRMILAAYAENCLHEVLIIAAALEVQDPRERPHDRQEEADHAHARFLQEDSDFLAYLKLWDYFQQLKRDLSRNQLRKACKQNFLSFTRMKEWADVHHELLRLAEHAGYRPGPRRNLSAPMHRAILAGLLSNVAYRSEKYTYSTAASGKFQLWPGSAVFEKKPKWIVAAELVETTRRFLRTCAPINPRWIEPAAGHVVRRAYSNARWESGLAAAVVDERVSLYELTVVPRRIIPYGPLDAQAAREILIEHGLVNGFLWPKPDFLAHNEALLAEMEQLQAKLRRVEMVRDRWARYEFYNRRIPAQVHDGRLLRQWLKKAQHRDPRTLYMTPQDLVAEDTPEIPADAFPDALILGGARLPLAYRFDPGAADDGVTLTVPVELLGQLSRERLEWLVPGLVEPKVLALIRALPKEVRRHLVPAPETARRVLSELRFGEGNFLAAVGALLSRIAGQPIERADFHDDKLPPELQMQLRVVAEDGTVLATGRDLQAIRRELGAQAAQTLATVVDPQWNRDGLRAWDLEELPRQIEIRRGALAVPAYPALVDRGDAVSLRLADTPESAEHHSRAGLRRLFLLAAHRELAAQVAWLPNLNQMLLQAATLPGLDIQREMIELIADQAFVHGQPLPRTRTEFQQRLAAGRQAIAAAVQDVMPVLGPLWEAYHQARLAVEQAGGPHHQHAVADIRQQLAELLVPGCFTATPWDWLRQFPRYLRAIAVRLDRMTSGNRDRDVEHTAEVRYRWDLYAGRWQAHHQRGIYDPQLQQYRWMLEEYRVSLFAQKLGTAMPISATRLEKHWATVRE